MSRRCRATTRTPSSPVALSARHAPVVVNPQCGRWATRPTSAIDTTMHSALSCGSYGITVVRPTAKAPTAANPIMRDESALASAGERPSASQVPHQWIGSWAFHHAQHPESGKKAGAVGKSDPPSSKTICRHEHGENGQ